MKGKPSYFRSALQSVIALLFLVIASPCFADYYADNAAILSALASGELIPKAKTKGGGAPNVQTTSPSVNLSASTMSSGSSYTGDSTAIVPDLFTGSFSTEVPIKVAPGRNGVEPRIVLNYKSDRTKYTGSIVGTGWELELGSIERSTMTGVNYGADSYRLRRSNGSLALRLDADGTYHSVIEGEFFRLKKLTTVNGPYWQLTDKSGVSYYFGQTAATRQDNPGNATQIFKWCLDKVEDRNGNYLLVSYFKEDGQIYPATISYTGNSTAVPSLAPTTTITFNRDSKAATPYLTDTTTTGFAVATNYRLKGITIKSPQDSLGRGYTFSYASSSDVRLKEVHEVNYDRSDSPPPPIVYEWASDGNSGYRINKITNSSGAYSDITYQMSSVFYYSNNGSYYYSTLPTLASVTVHDGNNPVGSTTTYTYYDGFWWVGTVYTYYVIETEFRGYAHVKVTGPSGPDGKQLITETYYHQGNETAIDSNYPWAFTGWTKGLPYRVRVTDSTGKKYSETTTSYASLPNFFPPLQVDSYLYDGDSTALQAKTVYTYGLYGTVTREEQYGDLSSGSDDRTIDRTFSHNITDWLVGFPTSEVINQGIGAFITKVAGKTLYYDDVTNCAGTPTNNQTPTKGKLTRVVTWNNAGTDTESRVGYDANAYGNPTCTRNPRQQVTTIGYDGSYTVPTTMTNALGHKTITAYYGIGGNSVATGLYGQVKSVTDPNSAATTFEYDGFGRKTKTTSASGLETTWNYANDPSTKLLSVRSTVADKTAPFTIIQWQQSYLDGLGRAFKTKASGPDLKTIRTDTVFDLRGSVFTTSLPYFENETSLLTSFVTDPIGRTLQVTKPDASQEMACYNSHLGVKVAIDGEKHRKRETYDVAGHLIKVEEYTGTFASCDTTVGTPYAVTTYQYDVLGNLRFVTDAKGNQTEMRYDSLSRKSWMRDPDFGVWSYGYDANNNLVSQTDAKNQIILYDYDILDRLILKNYPTGTDVTYGYDQVFPSSYGNIGRRTSMSDASGSAKYYYDQAGRATKSIKTVDGIDYQTSLDYDVLGRIKNVTYPDNETVGPYTYDAGGNLTAATGFATFTGYNALGQTGNITYGNGVVSAYAYNPQNYRLLMAATRTGSNFFSYLTYGYDKTGSMKTLTDGIDTSRTQTFVYDELNRLTQANSPAYGALSYSYDVLGNLLTKEGVGYSYGTTRPHAATTVGGKTLSYDANGNMYSDGQRTIGYSYENLPETITYGGVTTSFTYDGNGARVKKAATSSTVYLDQLYECTSGTSCVKYIYANGARIANKQAGQTFYYHPDHLGSTSFATNSLGSGKAEDLAYYPFGAIRLDTGTVRMKHKYTSQELDAETGLYDYHARMYDPTLGKFLTPDTMVPDPSNPQSFNRYSYVLNNPLRYTDPTGHEATINFNNGPSSGGGNDNTGGGGNIGNTGSPSTEVPEFIKDIGREFKRWIGTKETAGDKLYHNIQRNPGLIFLLNNTTNLLNSGLRIDNAPNNPVNKIDSGGLASFSDYVTLVTTQADTLYTIATIGRISSSATIGYALAGIGANALGFVSIAAPNGNVKNAFSVGTGLIGSTTAVLGGSTASVFLGGFGLGFTIGDIINNSYNVPFTHGQKFQDWLSGK